nr:putative pentatricopeptide repeat-containing protein At3g08820 [Tanacetum cinerariifolium]
MAGSANDARKTIVSNLQRELEAEATLTNTMLGNLTRYFEQMRIREIQITMLQNMPTMSLNSYGLQALLMTHEADIRTTNNLIKARQELLRSIASTRLFDFCFGLELHNLAVKLGFGYDEFVITGLVCFYAKCGRLDDASKLFDEMPHKNAVSWGAILAGYMELGKFLEAVEVFRRFLGMGLRPDSFTIVRVLSACAKLGDLRSVDWLDGCLSSLGIGRNIFVGTAFVDAFVKCGSMERALVTFDQMPEKDAVTWGAMIQGYASNGKP